MLNWLIINYIEVTGAILGLIYVILSIRQNISLWFVGILTSAFYIVVFLNSKLYANMALQFYYLIMSIYGWYIWKRAASNSNELNNNMPVSTVSNSIILWCSIIGVTLSIILWKILQIFTDSPFPILDSVTSSLSIIATWMITRKYLENWLLWIVADIISVGLYFYMKLFPTTLLFFIYTIMAVLGFMEWRKSLHVKLLVNKQL